MLSDLKGETLYQQLTEEVHDQVNGEDLADILFYRQMFKGRRRTLIEVYVLWT